LQKQSDCIKASFFEQIRIFGGMSRVLPNAMVKRAFSRIGVQNERLMADLPEMAELELLPAR
jgi:hypothetical protein